MPGGGATHRLPCGPTSSRAAAAVPKASSAQLLCGNSSVGARYRTTAHSTGSPVYSSYRRTSARSSSGATPVQPPMLPTCTHCAVNSSAERTEVLPSRSPAAHKRTSQCVWGGEWRRQKCLCGQFVWGGEWWRQKCLCGTPSSRPGRCVEPAPHKDFSDLYEKMSGRGESAVLSPCEAVLEVLYADHACAMRVERGEYRRRVKVLLAKPARELRRGLAALLLLLLLAV
eukprot:COSAG03_NODE_791_length_5841_cov_8.814589_5_plen_228_part_00